ncbi:hypothetical protein [Sinorhizobium meliloti]|uniref:hypothetical protein n=2 Tax=Rhizobium meliloti TaxID=382 RepID=UPI001300C871|nr:hypothetical protein [Sinorhizobium meliloti]
MMVSTLTAGSRHAMTASYSSSSGRLLATLKQQSSLNDKDDGRGSVIFVRVAVDEGVIGAIGGDDVADGGLDPDGL